MPINQPWDDAFNRECAVADRGNSEKIACCSQADHSPPAAKQTPFSAGPIVLSQTQLPSRHCGESGDVSIAGSQGADTISGGGGADTLTGNGGDDVFRYANTADSVPGAEDLEIQVTTSDGDPLTAGDFAL